ncbi:MAG TPA: SAF domain-containing protein [Streptosporangiaceae bacterium]|jgi:hypothetical protein|nr:SAF domain-containing protein [Streptosporangiaceae bacterium]
MMVFGVLVVVGCALIFAVMSLRAGQRVPVLAMSRDIPAGQAVTNGGLMVVRVSVPSSAHLIGDGERSAVVGRPAAMPLAAGSLLTKEAVESASLPTVGQAIVGVDVKPGRYPPRLAPGSAVQLYTVPAASSGGAAQAPGQIAAPLGEGTVLGVERGQNDGAAVIELQLPREEVPAVTAAAASGTIAIALIASRS